jgi:hypothetical protein
MKKNYNQKVKSCTHFTQPTHTQNETNPNSSNVCEFLDYKRFPRTTLVDKGI